MQLNFLRLTFLDIAARGAESLQRHNLTTKGDYKILTRLVRLCIEGRPDQSINLSHAEIHTDEFTIAEFPDNVSAAAISLTANSTTV